MLFSIADQIKHDIGNLAAGEDPGLRIEVAKLYGLVASKAVAYSDHAASCSYLENALSLLSPDPWTSHYDLSLRFSLQLAESCYSCGDVERAQYILQQVTGHCHTIEDKLPAHSLLARILLDRRRITEADTLCREVLSQLGEELPDSLEPPEIAIMVETTLKLVEKMSSEDLLNMKEMDERLSMILHFYDILGTSAYMGINEMLQFVVCRMIQLTMKNGLSKYSILALIQFAALLCSRKVAKNGFAIASRIGKAAMSCCKERYHTPDMVPQSHLIYYGFVAFHTEPLHTCADMLRLGFDAGMSLGKVGNAFLNGSQHIRAAIVAGDRLPTLLEKVDYYLKMANTYQNEIVKPFLGIFRGTISILIDNGESTSSSPHVIDTPTNTTNAIVLETINFHRAIQAYWQGHNDRCQHYMGKLLHKCSDAGKLNSIIIVFINGMNSFQLIRRQPRVKLQTITKKAIGLLKTAAMHSGWNFENKVHLLEAESFSLQNENSKAQASYLAAINSARASGFVHEQGLACELAGHHCKNVGDGSSAWNYFNQAKQCYTDWGSQLKVEKVTQQLDFLSEYMPNVT